MNDVAQRQDSERSGSESPLDSEQAAFLFETVSWRPAGCSLDGKIAIFHSLSLVARLELVPCSWWASIGACQFGWCA